MIQHLFVYGTLQPQLAQSGITPPEIVAVVQTMQPVGPGHVRGVLYDLGDYPGAILDPQAESQIHGSVFRLANPASDLAFFDEYEGFDPVFPESSLYVRAVTDIRLADGSMQPCWIYLYNRDITSAKVLSSGRYSR
jgi:gamma-glutamylcyclotransferase (GGCT)/AIG2-like uncharacterized protein YtfP